VNAQTLGDGQHDLPMGDRRADFLGNVQRGQQRPFLVAAGTRAALLAGEGDEHLMLAVRTPNSGEAFLQIAALEKGRHRLFDDRPPVDSFFSCTSNPLGWSIFSPSTSTDSQDGAANSHGNRAPQRYRRSRGYDG